MNKLLSKTYSLKEKYWWLVFIKFKYNWPAGIWTVILQVLSYLLYSLYPNK